MTIVFNNFFSVDFIGNSLERLLGFLLTPVVYDDLPVMKIKIKNLTAPAVSALPVGHFLYRGQHFIFHFLVQQTSLGAHLLLRDMSRQGQDQSEQASGHYEGSPPG